MIKNGRRHPIGNTCSLKYKPLNLADFTRPYKVTGIKLEMDTYKTRTLSTVLYTNVRSGLSTVTLS